MYLGLAKVELCIIAFTGSIRNIKDAGLCFKCKPKPRANECIFFANRLLRIVHPTKIHKNKKERVPVNEITILRRTHRKLRSKNALFIKTSQQLIAAHLEKFVPED